MGAARSRVIFPCFFYQRANNVEPREIPRNYEGISTNPLGWAEYRAIR